MSFAFRTIIKQERQPAHPGHPGRFVGHYGIPGVAMQGMPMHVPVVGGGVQMPRAHIMSYYVHNRVHNPVLLTSRPVLQSSNKFVDIFEMKVMQETRHMIQAKKRGEQFNEEQLRTKILTPEQCVAQHGQCPEISTDKPRLADVSQAAAMETEDQDFDEQEEVVDPNLEMFLRQAKREELVKLSSSMNSKLQKFKKGEQNLQFQLQELREEKYRRHVQRMKEKDELKKEMWRLQLKLNAFTGKHKRQSHLQESRAEAEAPNVSHLDLGSDVEGAFSKRAGTNIQFSKDQMIATRVEVFGNQALVFGSSPIRKDKSGWFYSVEVKATTHKTFWYGGLAIGVTQRPPSGLKELPDMGWQLEDTCLVGYWGCAYVNGVRKQVQWDPANLRVGSKVGVLVTKEGDLTIFVDEMEVDCLKGVINVTPELKLYPVMDIRDTCTSLKLLHPHMFEWAWQQNSQFHRIPYCSGNLHLPHRSHQVEPNGGPK